MPRRIDEIELVGLAVLGLEIEGDALGLDRNPPLTLQIHGVQHLGLHLPVAQAATGLDKPIGKGRLAVIDMGDDGEVADVFHRGPTGGVHYTQRQPPCR